MLAGSASEALEELPELPELLELPELPDEPVLEVPVLAPLAAAVWAWVRSPRGRMEVMGIPI
jgi:hypothetical protein